MPAYPRPQTIVIFLICALAVAGAAFYSFGGILDKKSIHEPVTVASPSMDSVIPTSTDWQKSFLSFASTSQAFTAPASGDTVDSSASLTATDILGMQFLSKYAQLQQAGLNTDSQAVNTVMGQLVQQSIASLPVQQSYTANDIRILENASTASMQAYGNTILRAVNRYMPKQNEAVIAENALENNTMDTLKQIDPIIDGYQKLRATLLTTPVPSGLVQYHLDLVNGVSIALLNAQSLRKVDTDPLQGLAAVSLELAGIQTMRGALSNMNDYFLSIGVPFGS